ncbi:MAG TPA: hypothetical protein VF467_02085 [Afipia sp.]
MPGLVPGIHVSVMFQSGVDGRDKPGHDVVMGCTVHQPSWKPCTRVLVIFESAR